MALFFALTLFVSAFLLFLVQPLVGKLVLPLLGGTPAVWSTCMVFFQALLLAGYAYAHAATRRLGARRQALLHLAVLALPLVAFAVTAALTAGATPIRAFPTLAPQGQEYPFFGVIVLLAAAIGVPFFVVSTSAPLLQRWFAETDHPAARDPYFLYAASNLGSLLALFAYPALIEPRYRLSQQTWLWAGGYALLVGLTAVCALRLRASPAGSAAVPAASTAARAFRPHDAAGTAALPVPEYAEPAPAWLTRLHWLALAFVPSSLMLGVTNYLTTDIAPIPLIWVIPLGLYLLTFIVAFGRSPGWVTQAVNLLAPVLVLVLLFMTTSGMKPPKFLLTVALHLVAFYFAAQALHLELAHRRPGPGRLTEFFLWMSLGGVLGGLFNALLAPLLFTDLTEYPLALIAACLLFPGSDAEDAGYSRLLDRLWPGLGNARLLDFVWPAITFVMTLLLLKVKYADWFNDIVVIHSPWSTDYAISRESIQALIVFGLPALFCYYAVDRPLRFGLSVAALWLAATFNSAVSEDASRYLHRERSFFGRLTVEEEKGTADGQDVVYHKLVHGTTLHGKQQFEPLSLEPLTYYHRTGPIGQVFAAQPPGVKTGSYAFVGLGSGSMASYGQAGQRVTFYEIDPAVRRFSEEGRYFTYLRDCPAEKQVVMGDARLKLEEHARDGEYGVIVVDAFSSDAIPVHLLTKEAVDLYVRKLAPGGLIALHVSNRYLKLEPVAARIAQELGLAGIGQWDDDGTPPGKQPSHWVLLARSTADFGTLPDATVPAEEGNDKSGRKRWHALEVPAGTPLWTDDFSNLLQIFMWE